MLLALGITILNAETGIGTIKMSGGFLGLDASLKTDITTYSIKEQHAMLFGSKSWFYRYNLTWYDSKQMIAAQNTVNTYLSKLPTSFANHYFPTTPINSPIQLKTPSIDYRLQGLDVNLGLGKDLYHKSENQYFGAFVMAGLSIPWINSKKDSRNNDSISNSAMNLMKASKTEISTYKIGLGVAGRVPLNKYFSLYGSATYAYQSGTIKNSYARADFNTNGIFQEYDIGIRFQPFSYDKKLGWLTLSPKLYGTLGYRYTKWTLKDINIDTTGVGVKFDKSDFSMNSSLYYLGLGYSF